MLAPLIAQQQGTSSAFFSITLDGLDVAARPGSGYGVDPESLHITEADYGQASSASFAIMDSQAVVSVFPGQFVRIHDLGLDMPVFVGWVDNYDVQELSLGRQINVDCVGIETALDWLYGPAWAGDVNADVLGCIQALIANAYGVGVGLRSAGSASNASTMALPIAASVSGAIGAIAVAAGPLRQQISSLAEQLMVILYATFGLQMTIVFGMTVDYWHNIRIFRADGVSQNRSDYAGITITTAAAPYPQHSDYQVGSAVARSVVVTNSGASPTVVSDGSGIPGPTATYDGSYATLAARVAAGQAYLASQLPSYSGQTTIEIDRANVSTQGMGTINAQRRAGSLVTFTVPQVGASGVVSQISSIEKSFADSGMETWTLHFGGSERQSAAVLLRKMTAGKTV